MNTPILSPEQIWETVLNKLRIDIPLNAFNNWLRGCGCAVGKRESASYRRSNSAHRRIWAVSGREKLNDEPKRDHFSYSLRLWQQPQFLSKILMKILMKNA